MGVPPVQEFPNLLTMFDFADCFTQLPLFLLLPQSPTQHPDTHPPEPRGLQQHCMQAMQQPAAHQQGQRMRRHGHVLELYERYASKQLHQRYEAPHPIKRLLRLTPSAAVCPLTIAVCEAERKQVYWRHLFKPILCHFGHAGGVFERGPWQIICCCCHRTADDTIQASTGSALSDKEK
jgi:hypothetical protein